MDMNDLLKLGATAFKDSSASGNAGSNLDTNTIMSALSGLTGSSSSGGLDIGEIIGNLTNSGDGNVMNMVQSWLGDGDNEAVSADTVSQMFDSNKLSKFASTLNLSEEEAVGGLQDVLPQLIDKASSGGSLLDSIGGVDGLMGMAKRFF